MHRRLIKQSSYTSDISMIASGIALTLMGVFLHQTGWILFGIPVSLIYAASRIYSYKGKTGRKMYFDLLFMLHIIISASILMANKIEKEDTGMITMCAIAILLTVFAAYNIARTIYQNHYRKP